MGIITTNILLVGSSIWNKTILKLRLPLISAIILLVSTKTDYRIHATCNNSNIFDRDESLSHMTKFWSRGPLYHIVFTCGFHGKTAQKARRRWFFFENSKFSSNFQAFLYFLGDYTPGCGYILLLFIHLFFCFFLSVVLLSFLLLITLFPFLTHFVRSLFSVSSVHPVLLSFISQQTTTQYL